jgi:hypothetical protein
MLQASCEEAYPVEVQNLDGANLKATPYSDVSMGLFCIATTNHGFVGQFVCQLQSLVTSHLHAEQRKLPLGPLRSLTSTHRVTLTAK